MTDYFKIVSGDRKTISTARFEEFFGSFDKGSYELVDSQYVYTAKKNKKLDTPPDSQGVNEVVKASKASGVDVYFYATYCNTDAKYDVEDTRLFFILKNMMDAADQNHDGQLTRAEFKKLEKWKDKAEG